MEKKVSFLVKKIFRIVILIISPLIPWFYIKMIFYFEGSPWGPLCLLHLFYDYTKPFVWERIFFGTVGLLLGLVFGINACKVLVDFKNKEKLYFKALRLFFIILGLVYLAILVFSMVDMTVIPIWYSEKSYLFRVAFFFSEYTM
ncbi:hypothetical protein KAU32_06955 [bacterium]|nr:hypothetical protein [bacterium]